MKKNPFEGKKVGLVLGGGGTHGFAHLGALEVLESYGIVPSKIAGCSVGALIGVALASGKTVKDISNNFVPMKATSLLSFAFRKSGLLKPESVVQTVLDFIGKKFFRDLTIPLVINATDINAGKEKFFRKGPLLHPLSASIAVPGVFSPVKLDGRLYLDGGVMNTLPLDALVDMDVIIAIDISYFHATITERSSSLQILKNTIALMQRSKLDDTIDDLRLQGKELIIIRPVLNQIMPYDLRKKKRLALIKQGKNEAKEVFSKFFGY